MSCPSFSEPQLKQMEKSIEKTNAINKETGFRIEKNGKLRLVDECTGDYCSISIKPNKKQIGTFHVHPSKPSNQFAPSPDDSYLAWLRGDRFHCVGGFGQFFEEKLESPTTRCWVTKMTGEQMHENKKVKSAFMEWNTEREMSERSRTAGRLSAKSIERAFDRLGSSIQRNIYSKRCEYTHEP